MRFEQFLLTLTLFLALAAGNAWADEALADTSSDSAPPSNIEGWDEDDEDQDNQWKTFFGISYESRQAASAAGGGAAGAASSIKKGGSRGRK